DAANLPVIATRLAAAISAGSTGVFSALPSLDGTSLTVTRSDAASFTAAASVTRVQPGVFSVAAGVPTTKALDLVGAPTSGDQWRVTVTAAGTAKSYEYEVGSGLSPATTLAEVAARLAATINQNAADGYVASANGTGTQLVISRPDGVTFTLTTSIQPA